MEVVDNKEMRHFEVNNEMGLAIIEYQIQEKKVFLTRTDFPQKFEESGQAKEMMEETLSMITENDYRVVPMNKFTRQYFRENPNQRKLLPKGLHI